MKLAYQPEAESNTIAAGEFKAKCLRLMDDALMHQRALTVTKRGKVIGQFVPVPAQQKPFRSIFGRSPGIQVLKETEWRKIKDEWAEDWDESADRLARQLRGDFKETKKKR